MYTVIAVIAAVFGILAIALGLTFLKTLLARLKVDSTIQIQCGTGDSEVMVMNLNRYRGEKQEGLKARMDDAWGIIQARRDFTHERWMKIQEESHAEKEQSKREAEIVNLAENMDKATKGKTS